MSVQCKTTQIWLKNFYRWSKKRSMCEENEWGVKNNTNTRSIPNLDQNILDSTSNSSSIRKKSDKVIKANLSKNMWIWKYVFHLSVMKIWASSRKSNQGSNKLWGTEPVIGVQCKNMIMNISQSIKWVKTKWKGVSSQEMRTKNPREKTC